MSGNDVGTALRDARQAAGLSGSKVARRAGLDPSYLSRIESGDRWPSRDALLEVTAALDLADERRDHLLLLAGYGPESEILLEVSAALAACRDPQRRALGLDLVRSACTVLRGEA